MVGSVPSIGARGKTDVGESVETEKKSSDWL